MNSKRTSDSLPLGGWILSEEDLRGLRRSRLQIHAFPLERMDELFPNIFPVAARRTTSEGWEPFRLGAKKS